MKKTIITPAAILVLALAAATVLLARNIQLRQELEISRAELEQVREDSEKYRAMSRSLRNFVGNGSNPRARLIGQPAGLPPADRM